MRYTITGRNIEVTPGLKAAVERRLASHHFLRRTIIANRSALAQKDRQKSR